MLVLLDAPPLHKLDTAYCFLTAFSISRSCLKLKDLGNGHGISFAQSCFFITIPLLPICCSGASLEWHGHSSLLLDGRVFVRGVCVCVCVCERDEGQRNLHVLILQRRILRRALYAFDRNPLLKNVSLLSVEAANAALLAYMPREHEELAKQAAEIPGRDTVVWCGGTLIRRFRDSASLLVTPPLSPQGTLYCSGAVCPG